MPNTVKYQKPFLKWVGGKHSLLPQIMPHVPEFTGTYYEPFLGGGALFFALQPRKAVLGDSNTRLVRCYNALQYCLESVLYYLNDLEKDTSSDAYYKLRDKFNSLDPSILFILNIHASTFIYLNKVGYGGMYRENKSGKFNVPYGNYKNPVVCDRATLIECSRILGNAFVNYHDFRDVMYDRLDVNDFMYLDPPYVPLSSTSSFTGYQGGGFSEDDHRELAECFKKIRCKALLSNSDTPLVRELYKDFEMIEISRVNRINSTGDRAAVTELLIKK